MQKVRFTEEDFAQTRTAAEVESAKQKIEHGSYPPLITRYPQFKPKADKGLVEFYVAPATWIDPETGQRSKDPFLPIKTRYIKGVDWAGVLSIDFHTQGAQEDPAQQMCQEMIEKGDMESRKYKDLKGKDRTACLVLVLSELQKGWQWMDCAKTVSTNIEGLSCERDGTVINYTNPYAGNIVSMNVGKKQDDDGNSFPDYTLFKIDHKKTPFLSDKKALKALMDELCEHPLDSCLNILSTKETQRLLRGAGSVVHAELVQPEEPLAIAPSVSQVDQDIADPDAELDDLEDDRLPNKPVRPRARRSKAK